MVYPILTPTKRTKITFFPMTNEKLIIAQITHNYGSYLTEDLSGKEVERENIATEMLRIHSTNMSYAKRRALNYFSTYF